MYFEKLLTWASVFLKFFYTIFHFKITYLFCFILEMVSVPCRIFRKYNAQQKENETPTSRNNNC